MMAIAIDDLDPDDIRACEQILWSLPTWFGIEAANQDFIRSLRYLPTFVARLQKCVVGFIALKPHNPGSIEVHVMAVAPDYHRQGIGRALLCRAEEWARAHGYRWLHVKTLGPSIPDSGYEQTRRFYLEMGFDPLFETVHLWGPENPALILVKRL
jgi:GNAT superfamily N-acetyltransferase